MTLHDVSKLFFPVLAPATICCSTETLNGSPRGRYVWGLKVDVHAGRKREILAVEQTGRSTNYRRHFVGRVDRRTDFLADFPRLTSLTTAEQSVVHLWGLRFSATHDLSSHPLNPFRSKLIQRFGKVSREEFRFHLF